MLQLLLDYASLETRARVWRLYQSDDTDSQDQTQTINSFRGAKGCVVVSNGTFCDRTEKL